MTDEETIQKVIDQVEKLLNLAAKNPNEHEAASAAAKAQELLARHNLSTAALEQASGAKSGKRMRDEVEGGFYRYQREVWESVAELNFCHHGVQQKFVPHDERVRGVRFKRRHVLIGRIVNVKTTIGLANYLLAAIERVTREVCAEKRVGHLSGWAMSFREGCAYRLVTKLSDRRKEMIDEEARKAREAWERAEKAGISLSTALTLTDHAQNEDDLNEDFRRGKEPGYTAAERAEAAKERREAQEAYTRWAAANPEEAKRKADEREAERERLARRYRGGSAGRGRYDHVNSQAFWEGDKRAKDIGLDPQTSDKNRTAGRLK